MIFLNYPVKNHSERSCSSVTLALPDNQQFLYSKIAPALILYEDALSIKECLSVLKVSEVEESEAVHILK